MIQLPKDKKKLVRVLEAYAREVEVDARWHWAKWDLFEAYVQGARRFDVIDAHAGRVASYQLDQDGRWQSQFQELLSQLNRVQGVLAGINRAPAVAKDGISVAELRDRAVAQVIADDVTSEQRLKEQAIPFDEILTKLGTCALHTHVDSMEGVGVQADHEVVHPREIFPFPLVRRDRTKACGVMRQMYVPLDVLKQEFGSRVAANLGKMTAFKLRYPDTLDTAAHRTFLDQRGTVSGVTGGESDESYIAVLFRRLWLHDQFGRMSRFVAWSGNYILHDVDYKELGLIAWPALNVCRMIETGGFYGAGLCDIFWSLHRDAERTLKNLVNNIEDIDRYPITLIPHGKLHERRAFKDDGRSLRILAYEERLAFAGSRAPMRPVTIAPHSSGVELPGRVVQLLLDLMDRTALVRDLARDKGRIDSLQALQFLDEQNKEPMTIPLANIARTYGAAHRYATTEAIAELLRSGDRLRVRKLDLSLVGANIDFESGTLSFNRNPVPDISRLSFKIKAISTASPSLRKREALELLSQGVADVARFRWLMVKEGLDPAMILAPEEAAYRTIVMNILALYGDGESPSQPFWVTPFTELPAFQLRVLNAFITGPELRLASTEVVNEFIEYREFLMQIMDQIMPPAAMDPVDIALLTNPPTGTIPGRELVASSQTR